jgi:hypothetical protein
MRPSTPAAMHYIWQCNHTALQEHLLCFPLRGQYAAGIDGK